MSTVPATLEGHPDRVAITISVMLAAVMQVLDTTIANVALPNMTSGLGASQDTITWVLTSYIVAAAIMTPVTGWLADRIGRKELFLYSIAGFTITSMICGMAWSLESMVAFRILQGLFGAALVPLSQTFLLDINPPSRRGSAMAIWGAGIMVGPIIGPTLGGWLTESFNWRWVFFINLPVGIFAFIGCALYLPNIAKRLRGFDFFGFAMLSLGVGALQLMLDRGIQMDWFSAREIWIELALSICGFWIFVVHTATGKHPFISPRIFQDRNFAAGLVFIFVVGIILLASLALLPPMLSHILGYPTITTGLVMAPRGVGTMISMIMVGRLMRRIDPRLLVMTGLLLTSWSLYEMTCFTPQMDRWPIVQSGITQGLGLGLVFVPLSTIAFSTIEPIFRTDATCLFSLVRNIGSSVGISVVALFLSRNTQINHAELTQAISPYDPLVTQTFGAQVFHDTATSMRLDSMITRQAMMISYNNNFKLMMVITLASLALLVLLKPAKPTATGH